MIVPFMDVLIFVVSLALTIFVLVALGQLFAIKDILADIRRNIHRLGEQSAPNASQTARDPETVCAASGCDEPRMGANTRYCKKHHAISA
jgi:hypothetical protein